MDREFDRDRLHLWPDEPLVALAAHSRSQLACDILILRHHPWISEWIIARGRELRLSPDDVEDATQCAVCVMVEEAIPGYHRHWQVDPSFKPFREYLACVEGTRFLDRVRQLRREAQHFEHSLDSLEFDKRGESGSDDQPLVASLRREFSTAFDSFLNQLSDDDRELWDLILLKASRTEMARKLCVPYGTVRRCRHRLLKRVWRIVETHAPFAGGWESVRNL